MSLLKLRRHFEERRQSLIDTLQKGRETLELSKQHQIYGAIKEIDTFLKAIEYHQEEQLRGDSWELAGFEPKVKRTFGSARERTKTIFTNLRLVLRERVAHPTKRAAHAVRKRVALVKEVAREVRARSKDEKKE